MQALGNHLSTGWSVSKIQFYRVTWCVDFYPIPWNRAAC